MSYHNSLIKLTLATAPTTEESISSHLEIVYQLHYLSPRQVSIFVPWMQERSMFITIVLTTCVCITY
ncbi:hypothetical protein BCON_0228g00140 [Botryotinia convoluta]|uniref:Uncharacterized protein n=1 Tax=Botryotinia convoluta TaxID=54673 RepID=A0A4Z1HNI1_9HELO|nr:hypothetical protein BCON_0228g00140 [Botryotinia convoluta]